MYSRIALLSASFSSPSTRKGLRPKGFSSRNCLDLVWRVWRSTVINSKSIRPMARSVSTALIGWPVRSPYNRSFVCGYIGKQFMKIGSRWLFTKWNDDMAKWVFRISSAISHWYSWLPWKRFSMSTQWQLEMPIWHRTALEIQELLASNHKIYCMKYHLIISELRFRWRANRHKGIFFALQSFHELLHDLRNFWDTLHSIGPLLYEFQIRIASFIDQ